MELEIRQYINSVFASNTWILWEGKNVYLIDCGDMDAICPLLPPKSLVKGVFLTHTHYDHIYGLESLLAVSPDIPVYTSAYGAIALQSGKMNLSRYWGHELELQVRNLVVVGDGDTVALGKYGNMEVLATPGHDESCLSYCWGNCLFTGDSFIPGKKVVTSLPTGHKEKAKHSLELILHWAEGRNIYPGHGPSLQNFSSVT